MMTIEEYINTASLIQYAILFFIAFLLMGCHNWLLSSDKPNPFKHSVMDLTPKEKIGFYSALLIGTALLMFWVASSSGFLQPDGLIAAIVPTFILSFFIVFTLNGLLGTMREEKLSLKFLMNQDFLLTAYLIIFTELSFLYWVKEIQTYVQTPFFFLVILYSLLIVFIGIFLGVPKKKGDRKRWPDNWRDNWRFRLVIPLAPIIIGLLMVILVKMTLDVIFVIIQ